MNMPLLDIEPRTLKFVVELKKQSACVVQLTNTTHHYVAFKVKTTSPKKYCVRPNVGIVTPKSSCEFTVIMQAFKEVPPDMVCKDKFLIQSTIVPPETTNEDITARMFSKEEGRHVEENKLRVTLVSPSNSPELSPINGTSKQVPVSEQSILKERVFSQTETLAPGQCGEIVKEPRMVSQEEIKPPKRSSVGFIEDLDPASDIKPVKDFTGYDTLKVSKETEFEPLTSPNDADDEKGVKPTKNFEAQMTKPMESTADLRVTNEIKPAKDVADLGESKITKDREFTQPKNVETQTVKSMDELNLVRDVKEMKLKVNALESKLKQADTTILKLMEERTLSSQQRQSLQRELAELKTKKVIKQVHAGFPFFFVFAVAIISAIFGYRIHR